MTVSESEILLLLPVSGLKGRVSRCSFRGWQSPKGDEKRRAAEVCVRNFRAAEVFCPELSLHSWTGAGNGDEYGNYVLTLLRAYRRCLSGSFVGAVACEHLNPLREAALQTHI